MIAKPLAAVTVAKNAARKTLMVDDNRKCERTLVGEGEKLVCVAASHRLPKISAQNHFNQSLRVERIEEASQDGLFVYPGDG